LRLYSISFTSQTKLKELIYNLKNLNNIFITNLKLKGSMDAFCLKAIITKEGLESISNKIDSSLVGSVIIDAELSKENHRLIL
jgi:hypothetical protein